MTALLALLTDPIWGPVIIGIGSIVVHKYVPILDPFLSKLPGLGGGVTPTPASPGQPQPVQPSAQHPLLDQIRAVLRAELASLLQPAAAQPQPGPIVPLAPVVPTQTTPAR